jgi:hypothetical protein
MRSDIGPIPRRDEGSRRCTALTNVNAPSRFNKRIQDTIAPSSLESRSRVTG